MKEQQLKQYFLMYMQESLKKKFLLVLFILLILTITSIVLLIKTKPKSYNNINLIGESTSTSKIEDKIEIEITDKVKISAKDTSIVVQKYPESKTNIVIVMPESTSIIKLPKSSKDKTEIPIITPKDSTVVSPKIIVKVNCWGFTAKPLLAIPVTKSPLKYSRLELEWLWYRRWNISSGIGLYTYCPVSVNYRKGNLGIGIGWVKDYKDSKINKIEGKINFYIK